MAQVDLKQLVQKLNATCHRALEAAAGACVSRTNYNVEIEHWLAKLLDETSGDVAAICRRFEIDTSRLSAAITRAIDRFKTGNSRPPALSPDLVRLIREAWLVASIEFGEQAIRSGHLLCALLSEASLARIALELSTELEKINLDQLRKELPTIVTNSSESATAAKAGAEPGQARPAGAKGPTKTPALDQFTIDLTERARRGDLDPVLGRDNEIRQMIDILTRRRQNNPILTGEAGVGKTAVVEGFAARVASGDVPPPLRAAAVRTLDLGLLQAGAGIKGEFENRLKSVIEETKASPTPIILFIDEAHTLIGAGGSAGQGDAANLLKPALARGELRTIAATTWAEYKKYFEKDAALARRFQAIKVDEPGEENAVAMLRGLLHMLESHHNVRILNEAVVDAVKLSSRYISGRQLPDKAVSVLDTTCARIGLSQTATPAAIEDCQRRIDHLKLSIEILEREAATGAAHDEQLRELSTLKEDAERELNGLTERWNREKELVCQVQEIQRRLEGRKAPASAAPAAPSAKTGSDQAAPGSKDAAATAPPAPELSAAERDELRAKLTERRGELRSLQGELPLIFPFVDSAAVAATIAAWTGIPVGRMLRDEIQTVMNLKELMEQSIVGQSHALEAIAQRIRTSRANLSDPRTPIGVFLLAGTSGVGKTETAITLANLLYGGEQNMTVLNMSEFKEEYRVSGLIGSAPGYVGFGEGGVLTEAVRRKPYSVVLLDEMEKAHPSVQDIFYQVFDKGSLRDGEGRDIDFKNTVIIMTSNAGTDLIKSLCSDPATAPEPSAFAEALFPELLKSFKPAFLGRLTIVPYYPLSDEIMKRIIHLKLGKVGRRIRENHRAEFHYAPEVVNAIALRCTEVDTGARNVDHILNGSLLPELSAEVLANMGSGKPLKRIEIQATPEGRFQYAIS
jgi:type VI secretion system protein VasG